MEIDLHLTPEDWFKFQKYMQRKKQKELKGIMGGFWPNLILWCGLTIALFFLYQFIDGLHIPTAIFLFIIFALIMGLFCWNIIRLQKAFAPSMRGTFVGKHHFVFDEDGIHSEGRGYKSFHEWNTVKSVERENGMIMCFIDTALAFIFPENQISDPTDFFNKIKGFKV